MTINTNITKNNTFQTDKEFYFNNNKNLVKLGKLHTCKIQKIAIFALKVLACISIIGIIPAFKYSNSFFTKKAVKQIHIDNLSQLKALGFNEKDIETHYRDLHVKNGVFLDDKNIDDFINLCAPSSQFEDAKAMLVQRINDYARIQLYRAMKKEKQQNLTLKDFIDHISQNISLNEEDLQQLTNFGKEKIKEAFSEKVKCTNFARDVLLANPKLIVNNQGNVDEAIIQNRFKELTSEEWLQNNEDFITTLTAKIIYEHVALTTCSTEELKDQAQFIENIELKRAALKKANLL